MKTWNLQGKIGRVFLNDLEGRIMGAGGLIPSRVGEVADRNQWLCLQDKKEWLDAELLNE